MRIVLIALIVCLCAVAVTAQDATPEVTPEATIAVDITVEPQAPVVPPGVITQFPGAGAYTVEATQRGIDRAYNVYIPESYTANTAPTALVIVLHGANGSGIFAESQSGFSTIADANGFIVSYPDGVNGYWNDGRPASIDARINPDISDSAYLLGIVEFLSSALSIDPMRVYIAGYSMGGMMAIRAGCELGGRVAAVASVASTMPEYLMPSCGAAGPLPVLFLHGTDDQTIPWNGASRSGIGYLSALDSLSYWGEHNACTDDAAPAPLPDADPADGTLVSYSSYDQCADGTAAGLYGVLFGGHTWPGHRSPIGIDPGTVSFDIDGSQAIWDFFSTHPGD